MVDLDGLVVEVGASIGTAVYPADSTTAAELLQHADIAMYAAKRGGLGVATYDPRLNETSLKQLTLLGELRGAMDRDELILHYQPKIRTSDSAVTGVEALVRWQHPQHGLLSSMAYLRSLPVHELKIDRTFVGAMLASHRDEAIVRGMVALARNLDLRVVAEGVEDEATLLALTTMDCTEVQGYFHSRPLAAPALGDWLAGWERRPASATAPSQPGTDQIGTDQAAPSQTGTVQTTPRQTGSG